MDLDALPQPALSLKGGGDGLKEGKLNAGLAYCLRRHKALTSRLCPGVENGQVHTAGQVPSWSVRPRPKPRWHTLLNP